MIHAHVVFPPQNLPPGLPWTSVSRYHPAFHAMIVITTPLPPLSLSISPLAQQRVEYEDEINRLSVDLLFASDFVFENGAISPASQSNRVSPPSISETDHDDDDDAANSTGNDAGNSTGGDAAPASSPNKISIDQTAASTLEDDSAIKTTTLILDRRKSVVEMIAAIKDVGGVKVGEKGSSFFG